MWSGGTAIQALSLSLCHRLYSFTRGSISPQTVHIFHHQPRFVVCVFRLAFGHHDFNQGVSSQMVSG